MTEKRRAKRMDISVSIKLRDLDGDKRYYDVDVYNISRTGLAFRSEHELIVDKCYDSKVIIWTKERIDTVVRIVRRTGDEYGAEFVGITSADEMKIDIYEQFNYPDE